MDFFSAKRAALQGYHIRRSIWTEDVDTPVAGSANRRVTAWLTYAVGLWYYRPTDGVTPDRVVEATDITAKDMLALDWTILDAEGNAQTPPDTSPGTGEGPGLPELPPILPPGANPPGGGGSPPGGGPGAGTPPGGNPGGGSPPGGGGGGGRPPRQPRPSRTPPSLTITDLNRTSGDECVPLLGSGAQNETPITDAWSCDISLGPDSDARPGETWFVSLVCGGKTRHSGTIAPGGTVGVNWSITSKPGNAFPVQANAYLAGQGLSTQASNKVSMRGACSLAPILTGFSAAGHTGTILVLEDAETPDNFDLSPLGSWSPHGLRIEWQIENDPWFEAPWSPMENHHVEITKNFICRVTNDYGFAQLSGVLQIED